MDTISLCGYNILSKISVGSQATVYLAEDEETKKEFVLKVFSFHNKAAILGYQNEIIAINKIQHTKNGAFCHGSEYIVKTSHYFTTDDFGVIVMEVLQSDFYDVVFDYQLTDYQIKLFFNQLCMAVKHCHSYNVAHLDIKLENCLYDGRGYLKLSDFGNALWMNDGEKYIGVRGTPGYLAPEVASGGSYCPKQADIYSLGVTFFVLATGQNPKSSKEELLLHAKSLLSRSAYHLLSCMLDDDYSSRFNIDQVLSHPYFISSKENQIKKESLLQSIKRKLERFLQ